MRTQYIVRWEPENSHQRDLWRIYKAWIIVPDKHIPDRVENGRVFMAPLDDENGIILDDGIWVKPSTIKNREPL